MDIIKKKSYQLSIDDFNNMYTILIDNLKIIFDNFKEDKNDKELWINSIKNNNYDFILIYDNDVLIAFLEYYIKDNIVYLSEIEISDKYKGDHITFRLLITTFYNSIDSNSIIRCNINDENTKSLSVFKSIGIKHIDGRTYEFDNESLKKYINKGE